MKQTAVEWLIDMLVTENEVTLKGENFKLFEMAKAMEKEQIMDAYGHGQNNGYMYAFHKTITINREQYYNETFKSE